MTKLPALQFYTGDWRKDPCVQAMDHEHKGVWIDLLCILNETSERGRLVLPDGTPFPDEAIARNLGLAEAKWKQIRSKLLALGVASEDERGVLYNRRIVRDDAIRKARAEAGRMGGLVSKPKQPESKTEANIEAKGGSSVSVAVTASPSPSGEKRARGGKKKATPLPNDWRPTDAHRQRAKAEGVDCDREAEKFRAHAEANDRRQASWNAAFTTWLLNAKDFQPRGRHTPESEKDHWDREIERFRDFGKPKPSGLERAKFNVPGAA